MIKLSSKSYKFGPLFSQNYQTTDTSWVIVHNLKSAVVKHNIYYKYMTNAGYTNLFDGWVDPNVNHWTGHFVSFDNENQITLTMAGQFWAGNPGPGYINISGELFT